jgi:hypothetical protein
MSYKSNAERAFFHTNTAKAKGIKPATVKEFDSASKGMKLPGHANNAVHMKGIADARMQAPKVF